MSGWGIAGLSSLVTMIIMLAIFASLKGKALKASPSGLEAQWHYRTPLLRILNVSGSIIASPDDADYRLIDLVKGEVVGTMRWAGGILEVMSPINQQRLEIRLIKVRDATVDQKDAALDPKQLQQLRTMKPSASR